MNMWSFCVGGKSWLGMIVGFLDWEGKLLGLDKKFGRGGRDGG